ncbi:NAD-dependent epimerase/dehydratase family protein [Akkermansiaceae bacterium]|nr:NAD-dependent epimerase/dehydratase family protein [Akkermansiaceae bacterium]MDB4537483.1 NAD-dependent epimerase/dehydratase family protein [Akkermansiaceae bacterium]
MTNLLIAGAGFLGSEIARQAAPDFHVTTLTKSGGDGSLACDLSSEDDIKNLRETIPAPDLIIHCASSGRGGPEAYQAIFVDGTRLIKETFPNAHLLFTSSTSVYHQTNGETVDESSPTSPERETSRLLLEAEKQVDTAARLGGLYGPYRSVVLRKFLADEAVIEEDGRRILNQIHVQDAASACLFLARGKNPGIYNVTDDTPMSQLTCYQGLVKHFNKPLPPTGERKLSNKRAWTHKSVKNTKIRKLGWSPNYPSFFDSLKE